MFLVSAKLGPFRSINTVQTIEIDPNVTVLVGMNEAGKTVLLKVLSKSNDASSIDEFDPIEDYPRKDLSAYLKQHKTDPAVASALTYKLTDAEVEEINKKLYTDLKPDFSFTVEHTYSNTLSITISVNEQAVIAKLVKSTSLSTDAAAAIKQAKSIRSIPDVLAEISLTDSDTEFLTEVNARIAATKWDNVVQWEVWKYLEPMVPKFVYFSDYDLLPGKLNLADLADRVTQAKSEPKALKSTHRAVLALLRMADVSVNDLISSEGYESLKAKIEAVSISLTDQIMEFWKQNEDLEVEVDIKSDTADEAPFNNGPNLYLRIKNRRHRGVSTPFDQRSRGFIWFFSFLVWFDSVQHQLDPSGKDSQKNLILLLDEPGLALHALAQADFLRYIDQLSIQHQVVYTTHSPFMVHSDRLHQVRLVEDQEKLGTVVSDNLSGSDPRTIFPLQAALGWTIAQNLFISERNLLVEGPSELIYLQVASSIVEANGGEGLRDDITIVPVGGLDKVVTFVALLGASGLKLAVLHDYKGTPEQKLMDLVRQKLLSQKALFNASQFRDLGQIGKNGKASDTEDLFTSDTYLKYFNQAFAKQLEGKPITEKDLPAGDRIVERLERYIDSKNILLRPSGGYNHYTVAAHLGSAPPVSLDKDTIERFKALFSAINSIFK